MNPYELTRRGADTLNLIMGGRLQFRLAGDGTVPPFARRWRTVGGHVGWHADLLRYANLYLDAGLIDYRRPEGRDVDEACREALDWCEVSLTRAGAYLFRFWREQPKQQSAPRHQSVICHYPDVDRSGNPGPSETVRFGPFTDPREKQEWAHANLPPRSFHFATLWRPDQLGEALASYREDRTLRLGRRGGVRDEQAASGGAPRDHA